MRLKIILGLAYLFETSQNYSTVVLSILVSQFYLNDISQENSTKNMEVWFK